MADLLQTSVNPYGSAVVLDSTPYVNMYLQNKAKEEAKNDALDKYYSQLGDNITPTGMHAKDVQSLVDMKNDFNNYYLKNKDAIRKGDTPEAMNYKSQANRMLGLIGQSKQDVNTDKTIGSLIQKKGKENLDTNSLKTLNQLHQPRMIKDDTGKWINNPNFNSISEEDLSFKQPFTTDDLAKLHSYAFSGLKPNKNEKVISEDKNNNTQLVRTTSNYDQNALNSAYNNVLGFYSNSPKYQQKIKDLTADEQNLAVSNLINKGDARYKDLVYDKDTTLPDGSIAKKGTLNQERVLSLKPSDIAYGHALGGLQQGQYEEKQRNTPKTIAQEIARESALIPIREQAKGASETKLKSSIDQQNEDIANNRIQQLISSAPKNISQFGGTSELPFTTNVQIKPSPDELKSVFGGAKSVNYNPQTKEFTTTIPKYNTKGQFIRNDSETFPAESLTPKFKKMYGKTFLDPNMAAPPSSQKQQGGKNRVGMLNNTPV